MGQNKSEKLLTDLATKTFFEPRVIPNPYKEEKSSIKEIADLVVIFDQTILIFSVKEISFDVKNEKFYGDGSIKNFSTTWNRWYKKCIKGCVQQLYGAEKDISGQIPHKYL